MREYPKITQGLGKFSPDLFERLMEMLEAFESGNGGGKKKPSLDGTRPSVGARVFVAKIDSSTAISGESNRFEYNFTEQIAQDFTSSSKNYNFADLTGGISDKAYNIMETNNTANTMKPGVDLSAADFPSGMSVQAIADDSLVFMRSYRDDQGKTLYLFQAENAIDGSCT
tara:strand:+ start:4309 stop:4818 length:510 start_codon:yes stop_codon:yes gene_type:complete